MVLRKLSCTLILLLILFTVNIPASAQSWDWHIENGTVIDGTGQESYHADLLIRGDSVGFVGDVDADTISAQHYVDASGKVVTPGFIDAHAHGNPLETPEFRNFLGMGVTTIVLGQDGGSPMPGNLDEWFARIEKAKPAVNIAMFSGHGSIRSKVDVGKQKPSVTELDKMTRLLEADLKAGAFGMSTGLEYVPGIYAQKEELQQMAKVVGQHGGMIMSHMRSEDDSKIKASLKELAIQGKYAPVHASHLKVVYGKGEQRAEEILNYIDSFREHGIEFTADVYPYEASYTGIGIVYPEWAKTEAGWKQAMKERPDMLRSFLEDKLKQRNGPDAVLFGSGEFAGQTLAEASKQTGQLPVDLLLEMGPEGASAAHFVMNEELQDRIVAAEKVMISSDGSPTMHHPRGYGSFAKIIEHYVKQKQMLTLEQAIYKMSGRPAQTLGLEDRGTIQEGNKADLLIFDPEEINANATFSNPHKIAEGFNWIMVNGEVARKDGKFSSQRNGTVLKKSRQ
ncbi:MAG: amidohydrolase family protein [Fodinibius sp.]|nr:amidohydrolase family protein [Fodinibius sp.]